MTLDSKRGNLMFIAFLVRWFYNFIYKHLYRTILYRTTILGSYTERRRIYKAYLASLSKNKVKVKLKVLFAVLILFIAGLLEGCGQTQIQIGPSPTLPPTNISTLFPTAAITSTPTTAIFIPTQVSGNIITPTFNFLQNIKLQTPEILDEIPGNLLLYGTLLISGYDNNPSYFLNLKDKSTKIVPDSFYGAQVSPDGKILAYFEHQENPNGSWGNLVVTNDFINKQIVPWKESWFLKGVGINGNLFILNTHGGSLPSFVLMNPKGNKEIEIAPDFPDIETNYYAGESWFPVYSPDGTKVVYPRISQTSRIALWDIKKQRDIATLFSINNPYGLEPTWSPDGKYFVMALENMYVENLNYPAHELFLGNASGQTRRLTYLADFFNDTVRIGYYTWSPDNIHIAFQVEHGETAQLAVINITTDELTVYQLNGYFVDHNPVWSPDGKYILIDGRFKDSNDYWTLLVDLEKNRTMKTAKKSFPVGWVAFSQ